jgi:gamma-glutamylcyclotransferase (GGCT)/AIG2-like uncharacterized protein YtfP
MKYLVGVYGTLRSNGSRTHVLSGSQFYGLARMSPFASVMVITPAGFPAIVDTHHSYLGWLTNQPANVDWFGNMSAEELAAVGYKKRPVKLRSHEDLRVRIKNAGLRGVLLELYKVTPSVFNLLNQIEGVPSFYQISKQRRIEMVEPDGDTRLTSRAAWTTLLGIENKQGYAASPHLSINPEQLTPYRELQRTKQPSSCMVYKFPRRKEWVQGCPIVWNGDYCNQLLSPVRYDYLGWEKESIKKGSLEDIRQRYAVDLHPPMPRHEPPLDWPEDIDGDVPDEGVDRNRF